MIIPAYNAERYLAEALESVLGQDCSDYEVIVIDDGSVDETASIADAFAAKSDSVRIVHQANTGLLLARRAGLRKARGKYVVFLDADDYLHPEALEIIAAAIEVTDADIVSFPYSRDPLFERAADAGSLLPGLYSGARYAKVLEHACGGRFNSLWGKAIRLCRIDLDAAYGAYAGLMHGEDLFQLLPILDRAESLVRLDDVLYYYRPNDASSTASYRSSQLSDIVKVNRRLLEYANKWGGSCPDRAIVGETNQYFSLLKMSELSNSCDEEKRMAFAEISAAMKREGTFMRAGSGNLRADNKMLCAALERGDYKTARRVVRGVELLKRLGFGG